MKPVLPCKTAPVRRPPTALTIAGTDPSGGAGIHADLKTFNARKVAGTSVITALVAQNTQGVQRLSAVNLDFIQSQFDSLLGDMPVDASKSGMLASREVVELVVDNYQRYPLGFFCIDPVMVATSGQRLLTADALAAVRDQLLPCADLVTPNLLEAVDLLGGDVEPALTPQQMTEQAKAILALGAKAVLLKGGHGKGATVFNVLATASGSVWCFQHPRINTANTHGTGCTLSAAITAEMARLLHSQATSEMDARLSVAVENALGYVLRALTSSAGWQLSYQPETAAGPMDHQVDIQPLMSSWVGPKACRTIRFDEGTHG